jgi:hypothetical protein
MNGFEFERWDKCGSRILDKSKSGKNGWWRIAKFFGGPSNIR